MAKFQKTIPEPIDESERDESARAAALEALADRTIHAYSVRVAKHTYDARIPRMAEAVRVTRVTVTIGAAAPVETYSAIGTAQPTGIPRDWAIAAIGLSTLATSAIEAASLSELRAVRGGDSERATWECALLLSAPHKPFEEPSTSATSATTSSANGSAAARIRRNAEQQGAICYLRDAFTARDLVGAQTFANVLPSMLNKLRGAVENLHAEDRKFLAYAAIVADLESGAPAPARFSTIK